MGELTKIYDGCDDELGTPANIAKLIKWMLGEKLKLNCFQKDEMPFATGVIQLTLQILGLTKRKIEKGAESIHCLQASIFMDEGQQGKIKLEKGVMLRFLFVYQSIQHAFLAKILEIDGRGDVFLSIPKRIFYKDKRHHVRGEPKSEILKATDITKEDKWRPLTVSNISGGGIGIVEDSARYALEQIIRIRIIIVRERENLHSKQIERFEDVFPLEATVVWVKEIPAGSGRFRHGLKFTRARSCMPDLSKLTSFAMSLTTSSDK